MSTVAVSSVGMAERVVVMPSETVMTGVTVEGNPVLSTLTHASVASARTSRRAAGSVGAGAGIALAAPTTSDAAVSSFLLDKSILDLSLCNAAMRLVSPLC